MEYMCTNYTKFGADVSSRFPFRAQTHTHIHTRTKSQTPLITLPYPRIGYCRRE